MLGTECRQCTAAFLECVRSYTGNDPAAGGTLGLWGAGNLETLFLGEERGACSLSQLLR